MANQLKCIINDRSLLRLKLHLESSLEATLWDSTQEWRKYSRKTSDLQGPSTKQVCWATLSANTIEKDDANLVRGANLAKTSANSCIQNPAGISERRMDAKQGIVNSCTQKCAGLPLKPWAAQGWTAHSFIPLNSWTTMVWAISQGVQVRVLPVIMPAHLGRIIRARPTVKITMLQALWALRLF